MKNQFFLLVFVLAVGSVNGQTRFFRNFSTSNPMIVEVEWVDINSCAISTTVTSDYVNDQVLSFIPTAPTGYDSPNRFRIIEFSTMNASKWVTINDCVPGYQYASGTRIENLGGASAGTRSSTGWLDNSIHWSWDPNTDDLEIQWHP